MKLRNAIVTSLFSFTGALFIALSVLTATGTDTKNIIQTAPTNADNYSFHFSSSENKPNKENGQFVARNIGGRGIAFDFSGLSSLEDGWQKMSAGGYFQNRFVNDGDNNAISGLGEICINFSGAETLSIGYGLYSPNEINQSITSGATFDFNSDFPSYFSIENDSSNTIDIYSIEVVYSCSRSASMLTTNNYDTYTIIPNDLSPQGIQESYLKALTLSSELVNKYRAINILLPEGNMYLSDTITFSGKRNHQLPICFTGNNTTIYGGHAIGKGGWVNYDDGIYYKDLPGVNKFFNLLVDGNMATLAKTNTIQGTYDNDNKIFKLKINDLKNISVYSLSGTMSVVLEERWAGCIGNVTSVDTTALMYNLHFNEPSEYVMFESSRVHKDVNPYCYLIDNLGFLDSVNEWYFDESIHRLYYFPSNPSQINDMEFIIPEVETILSTKGMVNDVSFKNITFNGSNFIMPLTQGFCETQATVYVNTITKANEILPGMVEVFSNDVTFLNCTFKNSASTGIYVREKTSNTTIVGCSILSSYGCGMFLGTYKYTTSEIVANINVTDCTVDGYGLLYRGGIGIDAMFIYQLNITHNTVCNGSYTGISAGWGWTTYREGDPHREYNVSFNRVYNVLDSMLYDGAPIYVLGGFPNELGEMMNTISHNYFEYSRGLGGIYLDEGSSSWHVHDNAINILKTEDNHFISSIFNHNPVRDTATQYCSANSIQIERNYATNVASFKTSTYSTSEGTYSGSKLDSYMNENMYYVETPVLTSEVHAKESIYEASGASINDGFILDNDASFANAFEGYTNCVVNKENKSVTCLSIQKNFTIKADFLRRYIDDGKKILIIDITASSYGDLVPETIVYYASGTEEWQNYYGAIKVSEGVTSQLVINLEKLTKYGTTIRLDARDSRGVSTSDNMPAYFTISGIQSSDISFTTDSGELENITNERMNYSYRINHMNYNWKRAHFNSLDALSRYGSSKVEVTVTGNAHAVYLFLNNTVEYSHRIATGGGKVTVDFTSNDKTLELMTCHEHPDVGQDDEGIYGTEENIVVAFNFIKNEPGDVYSNLLNFSRCFGNIVVTSYDVKTRSAVFSCSNQILIPSTFIDYLKENGKSSFGFDVTPNADSLTTKIVTVRFYKDGSYEYPAAFSMENGVIHVQMNETNGLDNIDHYSFVLRDDRGYGTAENQSIKNGLLSNLHF